jgi:hypothetical protein
MDDYLFQAEPVKAFLCLKRKRGFVNPSQFQNIPDRWFQYVIFAHYCHPN